jgi:hypothetical protein
LNQTVSLKDQGTSVRPGIGAKKAV